MVGSFLIITISSVEVESSEEKPNVLPRPRTDNHVHARPQTGNHVHDPDIGTIYQYTMRNLRRQRSQRMAPNPQRRRETGIVLERTR